MFEQQLRNSHKLGYEVTIFTLFGFCRGQVVTCGDSWFTLERQPDKCKINIYFEDVLLLEEHS